MRLSLSGLVVLLVLLCIRAPVMARDTGLAIINVNLFNGVENRIHDNVSVVVVGGRISAVLEAGAPVPAGLEVVDGEGNYLMPGLFDVHTHLDTLAAAERALGSGVTTVRSASVPAFQDVALRELVRAGKLAGPDVVAAGLYVTPKLDETVLADPRLVPLYDGVQSDEQLRQLVNINIDRGVDVIKTRGTERAGRADTDPREQVYSQHQLSVVVAEAARRDVAVMVHAHGDEGARAAVLAGARSIEHGTYLQDETLALMRERGTWLVPTIVTMLEMSEPRYDSVLRLRGRHMVPVLERTVRAALEQGVRIATGADNYYEAESVNRISVEVEHLVRLGMSPFAALQAATFSAAQLLQLDAHTGRIEAGYEADMILIPANPLDDVAALQDVLLVMSNGNIALNRLPFARAD